MRKLICAFVVRIWHKQVYRNVETNFKLNRVQEDLHEEPPKQTSHLCTWGSNIWPWMNARSNSLLAAAATCLFSGLERSWFIDTISTHSPINPYIFLDKCSGLYRFCQPCLWTKLLLNELSDQLIPVFFSCFFLTDRIDHWLTSYRNSYQENFLQFPTDN